MKDKRMKLLLLRFLLGIFTLLAPLCTVASSSAPDWMVNSLHASGKMNTVIVVVVIILVGLFFWMVQLDRRIRKIEKK